MKTRIQDDAQSLYEQKLWNYHQGWLAEPPKLDDCQAEILQAKLDALAEQYEQMERRVRELEEQMGSKP